MHNRNACVTQSDHPDGWDDKFPALSVVGCKHVRPWRFGANSSSMDQNNPADQRSQKDSPQSAHVSRQPSVDT